MTRARNLVNLLSVFVAGLLFAAAAQLAPASAQQGGFRLYPWCAYTGYGSQNCYYSSFEQCRESLGGHGMCSPNSWYAAYGPYYSFGRGGR